MHETHSLRFMEFTLVTKREKKESLLCMYQRSNKTVNLTLFTAAIGLNLTQNYHTNSYKLTVGTQPKSRAEDRLSPINSQDHNNQSLEIQQCCLNTNLFS